MRQEKQSCLCLKVPKKEVLMELNFHTVERLVAVLEDWDIYRAFRSGNLVLTNEIRNGLEFAKVGIQHPALNHTISRGGVFVATLGNTDGFIAANREAFDKIEHSIDRELGLA